MTERWRAARGCTSPASSRSTACSPLIPRPRSAIASPDADFPQNVGPYIRTDGALVANDWADLTDGTLQNPISHSHLGGAVSSPHFVWTGTSSDGTAKATTANTCSEWTTTSAGATVGFASHSTLGWWTDFATYSCLSFARIYCFEQ